MAHVTSGSIFFHQGTIAQGSSDRLFGLRPVQVMVRDEVLVSPAQNPFAALRSANEKLSAGKSLFVVEHKTDRKEDTDERLLSEV